MKNFQISKNLMIEALENTEHIYLFSTKTVAYGYDITEQAIRNHKIEKTDELIENKHWVVRITDTLGGKQDAIFWTLRGVLRLGFFIRSEQGKLFRDWAEEILYNYAIEKLRKKKEIKTKITEKKAELYDIEQNLKQNEDYIKIVSARMEIKKLTKKLKEIESGYFQTDLIL